ncbi:arabinofuranosyltransferase [Streptomyces blattellae]|uniref:arabinofuranosyltransferase n=1 Tax=Streptomyces blattellae TaxID=2569855 RepID=UPI0018AD0513|nr:arabinofuranosyltransferase [Streptomyces blattellae]
MVAPVGVRIGGQGSAGRPAPPTAPPRTGRRRPTAGRFAVELVLGSGVALVVSLGIQYVVPRLPLPEPSLLPTLLTTLTTTAVVVLLALSVLSAGRRGMAVRGLVHWSGYALVAALPTLLLALPLHGTRWFLGGLASDNQFRVEYLTRLTDSPALADFAYRDVPPLYPPGWFWAGGRIAALLGWDAWAAFKPLCITSAALAAALALALWRLLVPPRIAVLLAAATTMAAFVEPSLGIREPYAWLVGSALAPLTVIALKLLRAPAVRPWPLLAFGVAVGAAVLTYTMLAAFWVFTLTAMAAVLLLRSPRRWRTLLARVALAGIAAAPSAAVVLLPYELAGHAAGGSPDTTALKFIPYQQLTYLLPMTEITPGGLLCLAGTVWLVVRCRTRPVAAGLLALVAGCYAWCVLSQLAVAAAGTTLLSFRVHPVLLTALHCAGVLALWDLLRTVRGRHPAQARTAAGVLAVVAAVFTVAAVQHAQSALGREVDLAHRQSYPLDDGTAPSRTARVQHPGTADLWIRPLVRAIARGTGRQPHELTVLTDHHRLLSIEPYWAYLAMTPGYSNPLALHEKRNDEVRRWLAARDADDFARRLDSGRFPAPDVFVLRQTDTGYGLYLYRHNFPRIPVTRSSEVVFPVGFFPPSRFLRQDVGPYTVITRYGT